jgi:hypothetical protein
MKPCKQNVKRKSSKLFDKKLTLSHKKYEEICKLMENQKNPGNKNV